MLSVVKKFGILPVRSRGSMRFLYRALHWLQIGCQNPGKLTVGAYPSVKKTLSFMMFDPSEDSNQNEKQQLAI